MILLKKKDKTVVFLIFAIWVKANQQVAQATGAGHVIQS